jgi:DNA topoisomerase-2
MSELADKYVKKDLQTQIYDTPDTYVGGASLTLDVLPTLQGENLVFKEIEYVPGMLKLFDEILVNARDQFDRLSKTKGTKHPVTEIRVSINSKTVTVWNNGEGIDVVKHPEYKDPDEKPIYIPQLLFGELLTSANYNKKDKTTGGKNGYGAKLANIFSKEFSVKTLDHKRKKEWTQTFSNNMWTMNKPIIKKSTELPYTEISYTADFEKFGIEEYSDDMLDLMKKRVYDIAVLTPDTVKVYFNNEHIDINSLKEYANLMKHEVPGIFAKIHPRWNIFVTMSDDDSFQQVSFVNGIATIKGGKHVDKIVRLICKGVVDYIKKKHKKEVPTSMVKNYLKVFVDSTINDPSFNSQTKEFLESPEKSFGSTPEIPESMIKEIAENGLAEIVMQQASHKESLKAAKNTDGKKKFNLHGIPLLDDANKAGGKEAYKCTLILTEGNSAKTSAVAGISEVGKDYYGVFPLRGKVLNVKDISDTKIADNKEITNVKKIMGLQKGKQYKSVKELRYGKIMIMTDQDHDGSHIKGLIMNLFHSEWPELFQMEDFLCSLATPIVKATKGKQEHCFYNLSEYRQWFENNSSGWNIKYYKGLGTSTVKEAKSYFKNMKVTNYSFQDIISDETMKLAFAKDEADNRKTWLGGYNPDNVCDSNAPIISHRDFVDKELIHFSNDDCQRSIAHLMDGLKPSQRKVLFACFKKKIYSKSNELRVAQLAAYTSEHAMYHHGEASLQGTIVGMAQNYIGSNNINLLYPQGQFGSRLEGGADAAQPRYIYTYLEKLTTLLFPKEDFPVMKYLDDDGSPIEPEHYTPIIPMILVNGSAGIGTGYSSSVPKYNVISLCNHIKFKLKHNTSNKQFNGEPYYNGFDGTIEKQGDRYITKGVYKILKSGVRITELPIGKWNVTYKEFLDKSVIERTKDGTYKGFILTYDDNCTESKIDYFVKVKPDLLATWCEDNKLIKDLKLTSSITTSNMHLYNNDIIHKYNTTTEILEEFMKKRYDTYVKRKEYEIFTLKNTVIKLSSKKKYIEEINDSTFILKGKKKVELTSELREKKYPVSVDYKPKDRWEHNNPYLKNLGVYQESENDDQTKNGYDYLLNTPTIQLSLEYKDQLDKQCVEREKELEILEKLTIEEMWIGELDAFKKEYRTFLKN